jgi:cell wall-associated NlpC family hydrolase
MTGAEIDNGAPSGALSVSGADICTAARAWIGTRWEHQGRSREGVDCAGLILKVAHELGLTEFDTADYAPQATDETMLALCREHMQAVDLADLRPGDVVVMAFDANRHLAFVGDYLYGGLSLIHAYSQAPRRVVEHRFADDWVARVRGCFRFPEVIE